MKLACHTADFHNLFHPNSSQKLSGSWADWIYVPEILGEIMVVTNHAQITTEAKQH